MKKMVIKDIINKKVKKLKFYQMKWNTNVIHSKSKATAHDKKLVCTVVSMEHLGESERQGFCVGDILVSCSSERGTHVIKPTADATLHATMLMNNATKPMVFKVLRALNPEGKSLIQPEKEKTPLHLSHDETIARAIHSFQEIDVDKKGWLTKNETRLAYCDALGGVDVADDEFELEYLKMQQDHNGAISMEAFSMGFLRGLLFAELNGEGDDRVRENDINHCFTHLDFEGIHEEFAELYKSMLLHGENDVCLKSFKKHTNVFRKTGKEKKKKLAKLKAKTVANTKIAPSSDDINLAEWR